MNGDPNLEKEIFAEALELTPDQREGFLKGACRDDEPLRQRVEELLRVHSDASGILETDDRLLTMAAITSIDESPGTVIGRFKLLQRIGEGGCGIVYMAEQSEPVRRRVALKVIKLGMDTKSVIARFEAERQALAMMDHPNIAKVLDGGATDKGRPYFVMELVRGTKITEYCDQNNLTTRERLDLFIKVCQAIQHAHQKGIIHRDIKPSNILITVNDGMPVPKVIDFGIAKATTGQQLTDKTLFTAFEQFIGTPAYMSPEQAVLTSVDIDTRSDIYSLGVLLYEMLTGKTPFDGQELLSLGLDEMRRTIREKEPQRPSTRLSTMVEGELTTMAKHRQCDAPKLIHLLRGDVDWIVMKCLEKDRARRYETANGLAADIQRHLANEPVVARPPSAAYKLQKAWKRNNLVFTAGAAVILALVVGIGLTTWQAFVATRARGVAQTAQALAQAKQREAEAEGQRADAQARKVSESEQKSRHLLYASDMNLAQQSLKLNDLGRARRLLDRHRPQPGEKDLRGWEWRYLWQLTRSGALVTLTNRPTRGWSVSFSPDGRHLAVVWLDGHVDLWDVPGRRWVRSLTDREYHYPGRVAFSPVHNLVAATSESKVVTLYDLDSGRESILWRAPQQGAWNVRDLSFSQDSSRVVIYAGIPYQDAGSTPVIGDEVWVVNVSSSQIESHQVANYSMNVFFGAAALSPDNRRLYLARSDSLNSRYSIQCLELGTGKELWQTESQRDLGLTTLALSPDGRVLASGSGSEDPSIHVWEAPTGRLLTKLDGHTGWVGKLAFTRDGRRLISAAADQTIRFWDTSTWTETKVLRGHSDEIHAVTISERTELVASASKDGSLILWRDDSKNAGDGYRRLMGNLNENQVLPLDNSRVLLLHPDQPPALLDLRNHSAPISLPELGSSANVLGWFGTNTFCQWDGTNQILVCELRGAEFMRRGAIALDTGVRPSGLVYNGHRQLIAWSEGTSSTSVCLASIEAPGRRIELRGNVPGLIPFRFSEDGAYLAARKGRDSLIIWNVESGQIVASITEQFIHPALHEFASVTTADFAAGGRVLVTAIAKEPDHEIRFYDLAHPDRAPRRVPGRHLASSVAVSPDGGLVAVSNEGGQVRLFDPAEGEGIEDLHGHLNAAFGLSFSPDGQRLISAGGGREAIKLWDIGTRQELLTLRGTGSTLRAARWSADGDVILAGPPWQVWRAPSWKEIAAAEAKDPSSSDFGGRGKTESKKP